MAVSVGKCTSSETAAISLSTTFILRSFSLSFFLPSPTSPQHFPVFTSTYRLTSANRLSSSSERIPCLIRFVSVSVLSHVGTVEEAALVPLHFLYRLSLACSSLSKYILRSNTTLCTSRLSVFTHLTLAWAQRFSSYRGVIEAPEPVSRFGGVDKAHQQTI